MAHRYLKLTTTGTTRWHKVVEPRGSDDEVDNGFLLKSGIPVRRFFFGLFSPIAACAADQPFRRFKSLFSQQRMEVGLRFYLSKVLSRSPWSSGEI
ncbi:hypothetical protein VSDG_07087 [Cytospora chrysosperma]|uniref:Uncharacterized protein n=1 Tax=Cytospora chrysosperma TaxID=252740 RepID=A0A423VUY2_CYTCH|nr:hypothetical protein VSDG_07087 [Valsa sordida]